MTGRKPDNPAPRVGRGINRQRDKPSISELEKAPMFLIRKPVFVAIAATLLAQPVLAQESPTLKKIKDSGTIALGHRESSIPFSYYDDKQQVVGYSQELMLKVVDAVKAELKMPTLQVKLTPVTSQNRIPLVQNGTVDIECGSTTHNAERARQVAFSDRKSTRLNSSH